jgi:hypothetical protein
MQTFNEREFAAMERLTGLQPSPPGEDLGEIGHIGLAIAASHAERVQFERLARQILVKALVLVDAGDRVRAHRLHIVEVEQHRRMAFHRQQKIGKAAEHVRPDGFAFVSSNHGGVFIGGNAEVVGPEPDQTFDQADLSTDGSVKARFGFAQNDLLRQRRLLNRCAAIWARQFGHLRSGLGLAACGRLLLLACR